MHSKVLNIPFSVWLCLGLEYFMSLASRFEMDFSILIQYADIIIWIYRNLPSSSWSPLNLDQLIGSFTIEMDLWLVVAT